MSIWSLLDLRPGPDPVLEYKGTYDKEDNIIVWDNGKYNRILTENRRWNSSLIFMSVRACFANY